MPVAHQGEDGTPTLGHNVRAENREKLQERVWTGWSETLVEKLDAEPVARILDPTGATDVDALRYEPYPQGAANLPANGIGEYMAPNGNRMLIAVVHPWELSSIIKMEQNPEEVSVAGMAAQLQVSPNQVKLLVATPENQKAAGTRPFDLFISVLYPEGAPPLGTIREDLVAVAEQTQSQARMADYN